MFTGFVALSSALSGQVGRLPPPPDPPPLLSSLPPPPQAVTTSALTSPIAAMRSRRCMVGLRRRRGRTGSAFHGTGGQPAHQLLLEQEQEDHERQRGDDH